MYKGKTVLDSRQNLTLYIEGLFQRESELEIEVENPSDVISSESKVDNKDIEEESGALSWGKIPFDCLLIKAAGMNFIIPTTSISYIERVNKKIIRIPLEVESLHGVITLREKNVAVIDLFSLITEDKNKNTSTKSRLISHHIDHVLVMENSSYVLACEEVYKMITLNTEDVRWNRSNDDNQFYAGIVKDYLCPLLNINNLHQRVISMPFVQSLSESNY